MRQDAAAGGSIPYVISPEDLIQGSLKNYCGVVLDCETEDYLGTTVLFVPPDPGQEGAHFPRSGKSAWVTSINVVGARSEVLVRNSKKETRVAQLLLTSSAFGLVFLSVHTWPGTFGLAFLRMVTGPSSLPHREFVEPQCGDRVYVLGFEANWESGIIADVRLRPAKVISSVHGDVVKVDFTAGQLGGMLTTPRGFMGGLVVRADGYWTGLMTCKALPNHPELADFASASNIYSLLEEL
ncbi:unnamed protein product [Sphagnum compactum]